MVKNIMQHNYMIMIQYKIIKDGKAILIIEGQNHNIFIIIYYNLENLILMQNI